MFDTTQVVPEARHIVERAAQIYYRHTQPWFIGLIVHGSACKGGFIPNGSDIDLQLFLQSGAFDSKGQLPIEITLAIHRELATIDHAPFQYIQCYAMPDHPTAEGQKGFLRPIPGTYYLLHGELPVAEATAEQISHSSHELLSNLEIDQSRLASRLLQHGSGILERSARFLCTEVWPSLYSMLTIDTNDPLRIWTLTKTEAIALLSEDQSPGQEIRQFYNNACAYYIDDASVENALIMVEKGLAFKYAVKTWYVQRRTGNNRVAQ